MKIEETLSTAELAAYNATTLAYIGDAVMSLWVRTHLIMQGCGKTGVLQKQSEAWVSARAQSTYLRFSMKRKQRLFYVVAILKRKVVRRMPV